MGVTSTRAHRPVQRYDHEVRRAALVILLTACGASTPPPVLQQPSVARVPPPPQIDPDARGAAYLTAVALQLQPAWHQFLEDCRLRLPQAHALNRMSLATTATLEIGPRGELVDLRITSSGTADFDHAIGEVVRDAAPLPAPPRALWSDDDHVHIAWVFARDRRQAGPATARVLDVELELNRVVDRLIGQHDLARAARRILRAKPSAERDLTIQRLMIAALREAIAGNDARRAAVDAVGQARASELAMEVRQLLTAANDIELRIAATRTAAALGDADAVAILLEHLRADLRDQPRLALAETRALVELGRDSDVRPLLAALLNTNAPNPNALAALALAPVQELAPRLSTWFRSGAARTRAAVCSALAGYPVSAAGPLIDRGLRDRDATVRANCLAARRLGAQAPKLAPELGRDGDSAVRAAYAIAPDAPLADLRKLIEDREPDVREAAWTRFAVSSHPERAKLAAHAAGDPAAAVRRAAAAAIEDDAVLTRLARSDDDADVRTAALVRIAARSGRAATADQLVERLADASPGSAERVRTALAWLLAR